MFVSTRSTIVNRSRRTIAACFLIALAAAIPALATGAWQPLPDVAPAPADNPTTPAKIELGKHA